MSGSVSVFFLSFGSLRVGVMLMGGYSFVRSFPPLSE